MNIFLLPLVISLTANSGDAVLRYPVTPDPNDTASWNDACVLNDDISQHSIFMHYFDDDYYIYTSSHLRSVAIRVNSTVQTADIRVYKNGVSINDLVASYDSTITFDYNSFASYLICVGIGDVLYIEIDATTTTSTYDVVVDTNPNLSGIFLAKDSNENLPTKYYNGATTINYYIDSSCDTNAGYTGKTFRNSYIDAINEWNKVGSLSLNVVNNQSLADVVLYANDSAYSFDGDDIGKTFSYISSSFFGIIRNFYSTDCHVMKYYSNIYGPTGVFGTYLNTVSNCMRQIGQTLGLAYNSSKKRNFMYSDYSQISLNPYNEIGDGDVASYLSIHS